MARLAKILVIWTIAFMLAVDPVAAGYRHAARRAGMAGYGYGAGCYGGFGMGGCYPSAYASGCYSGGSCYSGGYSSYGSTCYSGGCSSGYSSSCYSGGTYSSYPSNGCYGGGCSSGGIVS